MCVWESRCLFYLQKLIYFEKWSQGYDIYSNTLIYVCIFEYNISDKLYIMSFKFDLM